MAKDKKPHKCTHEGCKAAFPRPSKLAIHMKTHTGVNPFKCDVDGCDKTYTTKSHLKRHHDVSHKKMNTKVLCTFEGCYLEFSNDSNMKRHLKRAHTSTRKDRFTCPECNQGFSKKRLLHVHSYCHTGIYYYKCDICLQDFPSPKEVRKHKHIHMQYSCAYCEEKFVQWTQLRKHLVEHRPVFKCDQCSYTTKQKLMLDKHKETHLDPERRIQYQCPYPNCQRRYLYKRNLTFHIQRFHDKVKLPGLPCTAEGCKVVLSRKGTLKSHMHRFHSQFRTAIFVKPRRMRHDCGKHKKPVSHELIGDYKEEFKNASEQGL